MAMGTRLIVEVSEGFGGLGGMRPRSTTPLPVASTEVVYEFPLIRGVAS